MFLKHLTLRNFRNFEALSLDFHPEFNFIFGKNAQGKTNLIEAIFYLSSLKSFRTSDKNELLRRDAEGARLQAVCRKDDLDWEIGLTLSPAGREVTVNGKKPPARRDYHALLPLVLFEPRHIYLFRGSPSERRQYLNRALFLQDPGILTLLNDYEKTVTQKNRLLKEFPDRGQLEAWNGRLAALGAELMRRRARWFGDIGEILAEEYRRASGSRETLRLVYAPSVAIPEGAADGDFEARLAEELSRRRDEEVARREAVVGPHRDDWNAFLDERSVGKFGSQGENRGAVIALKLAQLKLYASRTGKTPLFLLDDVASELDAGRCRALFSYLRDESAQVFLTTTENDLVREGFSGRSKTFLVENGAVGGAA